MVISNVTINLKHIHMHACITIALQLVFFEWWHIFKIFYFLWVLGPFWFWFIVGVLQKYSRVHSKPVVFSNCFATCLLRTLWWHIFKTLRHVCGRQSSTFYDWSKPVLVLVYCGSCGNEVACLSHSLYCGHFAIYDTNLTIAISFFCIATIF